jgi:hypothetical protein
MAMHGCGRAAFLSLVFICLLVSAAAQKKKLPPDEGQPALEVTGKFDETMNHLQGKYMARVLRDNKVVQEQELKVSKGFRFVLNRDAHYTIKIEKEGYIPRLLSIDTRIPEKAELDELFKFYFETNLIDDHFYHHFDADDVDFPIALVAYARKCDCFQYDKKYTEAIMNRIVSTLMLGGY